MKKFLLTILLILLLPTWAGAASATPYPTDLITYLTSIGEQNNALFLKGFLDVQLYDLFDGVHRVDPTGVADSTVALNEAIKDARNHNVVVLDENALGITVLFTHQNEDTTPTRATYKISSPLLCRTHVYGNGSEFGWGPSHNFLLGSTSLGKAERPLIKLAASATYFANTNAPRPAVWFWMEQVWSDWEASPFRNAPGQSFDQVFRGIDIDLNDNPGAIGVSNYGAQGCAIQNTTIDATNAKSGIENIGGLGSGAYDVEVIGGQYGLYLDLTEYDTSYNGHVSMIGWKFTNQTVAAIHFGNQAGAQPVFMLGCEITNSGSIPINRLVDGYATKSLVMVDCVVDVAGGTLINRATDTGLYLHNIYTRGASTITLDAGSGLTISDTANWSRIYSYVDPEPNAQNCIDGSVDTTIHSSKIEGLSYTKQDILDSVVGVHRWDEDAFPSFQDAGVLNVKSAPYNAIGDADNDDTAELQAAIDAGHAGSVPVFIPRGQYKISDTLTIYDDTKLIGAGKSSSIIFAVSTWQPGSTEYMLETEDNAEGTTIIADIGIFKYAQDQGYISYLRWRTGENSILLDVNFGTCGDYFSAVDCDSLTHQLVVDGHGGGKWYNTLNRVRTPGPDGTSRSIYINGTDEPMHIYPQNLFGTDNITIEVHDSSNKYIYHPSFEGGETYLRVDNSDNLALFCAYKNNVPETEAGEAIYEVVGDSDRVLIGVTNSNLTGSYDHLREEYALATNVITDHNIALFSRGAFDYQYLNRRIIVVN